MHFEKHGTLKVRWEQRCLDLGGMMCMTYLVVLGGLGGYRIDLIFVRHGRCRF